MSYVTLTIYRTSYTFLLVAHRFDKPNQHAGDPPFGEALANALKQLADDPTYRMVRRMSFSAAAADPVASAVAAAAGQASGGVVSSASSTAQQHGATNGATGSAVASLRNSAGMAHDLQAMEQLLAAMSERQRRQVGIQSSTSSTADNQTPAMRRTNSGVRMPTIMEKMVVMKRRSLGADGSSRHRHSDDEVNLTQNVLD